MKPPPDMRASVLGTLVLLGAVVGSCVDSVGPKTLSAPTNVTVTLVGRNSARISWTASPEGDYVQSYSVVRDGEKIGESKTTTFDDTGLTEGVTYKYRVSAGGFGLVSPLSEESAASSLLVPDATPPTIMATSPAAGLTGVAATAPVSVTFSEPLDATTVGAATIIVATAGGAVVQGTLNYTAATSTVQFVPAPGYPNAGTVFVTVTTGIKDIAGNRLASDFRFSFTTRDATPPAVVSVSPANGAGGVSPGSVITVTFGKAMDASTINSSTLSLKVSSNGASVPATVTYNPAGSTATITPAAPLSFTTAYTVLVSPAVKDVAGNTLVAAFSSSFTTGAAPETTPPPDTARPPDTTPPTVLSVSPADGSLSIPANTSVLLTFSEAMDGSTINGTNITLSVAATSAVVPASVTYNAAAKTATLTPLSALAFSNRYAVLIGLAVKDLAGNPLRAAFSSSFTTASAPDLTAPTVVSVTPSNLASGLSASTTVAVTFSEAMNPATVNTSTFTVGLTGTSVGVTGTVAYNASTNSATFTPSSPLAFSTSFTVAVSGATDLAGNALASTFSSIFATGPAPDTIPPTVLNSSPVTGATAVAVTAKPTVTFSKQMNATTVNVSTITLTTSTGTAVTGSVVYDPASNSATFIPAAQLSYSTNYTLAVSTGVRDFAGNAMAAAFTAHFATMPSPDTTSPTVISWVRLGGTGPLLENRSSTSVTFSEPMNPASINASTVTMTDDQHGGVPVPGTFTYDSTSRRLTFAAASPLSYFASGGGSYTLSVSTGVTDLAGNGLAARFWLSATRISYFQGDTDSSAVNPAIIHLHITFSQDGQALGRAVECQPLPSADCDVLPRNQAGIDAVGPLDDPPTAGIRAADGIAYDGIGGTGPIAATITAVTGTFTNPGITFTFTLKNGRTFTFTGTMTDTKTMTGTLTGATLGAPMTMVLSR